MTLLKLENLSLKIHEKDILKSVSLEIKNGEIFGLLGESGCGKSMTAAAITKLLPNYSRLSGRILLENSNIIENSDFEMCKIRGSQIAMVFQEPMTALNPLQTIGNQIEEMLIIHTNMNKSNRREMVDGTLSQVGLDPRVISSDRFPHELSGGQRQRVMIAMALVLKPKLIIADEPTTALDVKTQRDILNLLQNQVIKENISLLLITHDLAVIAGFANRIAIMKDGELVDKGNTDAVFNRLSHQYTNQILLDTIQKTFTPFRSTKKRVLNLKSVTKTYSKMFQTIGSKNMNIPAIKNVTFSMNEGECLGLVGQSGCGKSTLARCILGLESLDHGTIVLDGSPISLKNGINRHVRSKIQVVFQDPFSSFNPRHRISKIISEPLNLLETKHSKKVKSDLLKETILNVGMSEDDLIKYPHQFSGGQRQRIALARALIIRPKLIILDEALSALDVSLRSNIISLLQKLSLNYNLSYLFISHDIHLIKAITNRVLIMQKGNIVESGKTEKVLKKPKHNYTKELISATPAIPSSWIKNVRDRNTNIVW